MRMWLIGLMGSGKTSSGRLAAHRLGVPFHDVDDLVAAQSGRTVAEVWQSMGEEGFRRLEAEAMRTLSAEEGIIATGGGAVLGGDNRRLLSGEAKVVWLIADIETLAGRLDDAGGRPLLSDPDEPILEVLAGLLDERRSLYQGVATHQVDTTGSDPVVVARRIEEIWNA